MDFVIRVVRDIFRKPQQDAVRIMLITRYTGATLCGVYARHDAQSLVERVADMVRQNDHRLRCLLEPECAGAAREREFHQPLDEKADPSREDILHPPQGARSLTALLWARVRATCSCETTLRSTTGTTPLADYRHIPAAQKSREAP
jgi:hypothetical protein